MCFLVFDLILKNLKSSSYMTSFEVGKENKSNLTKILNYAIYFGSYDCSNHVKMLLVKCCSFFIQVRYNLSCLNFFFVSTTSTILRDACEVSHDICRRRCWYLRCLISPHAFSLEIWMPNSLDSWQLHPYLAYHSENVFSFQ